MSFTFNAVELHVVTLYDKSSSRAKEVCKALKYRKETANVNKHYCSKENYTEKYQLNGAPSAVTPVDCKSTKFTSMRKGCMSCYFLVNGQK